MKKNAMAKTMTALTAKIQGKKYQPTETHLCKLVFGKLSRLHTNSLPDGGHDSIPLQHRRLSFFCPQQQNRQEFLQYLHRFF